MRRLKYPCEFLPIFLVLALLLALNPLVMDQTVHGGEYELSGDKDDTDTSGDDDDSDSDSGAGWLYSYSWNFTSSISADFDLSGSTECSCNTNANTTAYSQGPTYTGAQANAWANGWADLTWTWKPSYPGEPAPGLDCTFDYNGQSSAHADGQALAGKDSNAYAGSGAFASCDISGDGVSVSGDSYASGTVAAGSEGSGTAWASISPELPGDDTTENFYHDKGSFAGSAQCDIATHNDDTELPAGGTVFVIGTGVDCSSGSTAAVITVAGQWAYAYSIYPASSSARAWGGNISVSEK